MGYAIQFDSTENDTMSLTLMGVKLFEEDSKFFTSVKDIILEHGLKNWRNHPYTDTMRLKEKFDDRFSIIGDFDLFLRLSKICLFESIQTPLGSARIHSKNLTTLMNLYKNADLEQTLVFTGVCTHSGTSDASTFHEYFDRF